MGKEIIWVYGSLRYGEYNYYLIKSFRKFGLGIVRGFKMYSFGSYPFVVQTGNPKDIIVVEGYEVDKENANDINSMEFCAGYSLASVEIEVEEGGVTDGNIYKMDAVYRNCGEVEGGDWVKNKPKRYLRDSYE